MTMEIQQTKYNTIITNKKKEFKWRKLIKAYKVAHYNNALYSTQVVGWLGGWVGWLHA